ncbi:MAG: hypothetical protein NXH75_06110 [Halobacteriovoraceae bacterium]|nr:hypothetical protein [Halobacteriovoraceae bacterium]
MKLKLLILFGAFFLILMNAFPGGVTVGNGTGKVIVGFSVREGFQTEKELMIYTQNLIYDIRDGKNPRIEKMILEGQCEKSYRSVKRLETETFIPIVEGSLSESTEYIGYLLIELDHCKVPDKITADLPYGGSEFWDL